MEGKELNIYERTLGAISSVLTRDDFAVINGRVEITRDGALKILSSMPASYEIEVLEQEIKEDYARVSLRLKVTFEGIGITRVAPGTGVCEKWEFKRDFSLHNMLAKAETRALKRAIEGCLGAVVNAVIVKLFGSLEGGRRQ